MRRQRRARGTDGPRHSCGGAGEPSNPPAAAASVDRAGWSLEGCLTEQWRWLTGRRRWLTAAPLADWAAPLNAAGRDINGHCKSALFLQRKLQAVL